MAVLRQDRGVGAEEEVAGITTTQTRGKIKTTASLTLNAQLLTLSVINVDTTMAKIITTIMIGARLAAVTQDLTPEVEGALIEVCLETFL